MILPLPALLTIQFGINEPRFASVAAILRATRQTIQETTFTSTEEAPGLTVRRMYIPEVTHQAEMLEGSGDEVAQQLAAILREKGLVPEA